MQKCVVPGCVRPLVCTIGPKYYPSGIKNDKTIKYFYRVKECEFGHVYFVCINCEMTILMIEDLYVHTLICCCKHTIHGSPIYTGCQVYETKEIRKMIEKYHKKKGIYLSASDVNLYVSSHRMKTLFPQFIYLQRNEEVFKRIDIGNICFNGCYISTENELRAITCPVETINDTVKSIIDEFIRCSYGLEFQCSIPISIGVACDMVYDCFPSKSVIDKHCVVQHRVSHHSVVQHNQN